MNQIWEKFSWLSPEFIIEPAGTKSVKIKGVAVPPNIISKNNRRYVDKEMVKAARTWNDKPITINHEDYTTTKNRKGKVNWMEFDEEDGKMEYIGELWNPEVVNELRLYAKDKSLSRVRGVSIEADYMYNRCAICDKKFYTEDAWRDHMINEEFVKELPKEPHGIVGRALTIVMSPEEPGCDGTTIELLEAAPSDGLSRLIETVIKNEKEREKHMKKSVEETVKSKGPEYIGKSPLELMEQEEHECPEGERWDAEQGKCVKTEQASEQEHECPEGQHWSEEQQKCVANVTEQERQCPEGEHWDEAKQACVKTEVAEQEGEPCPKGQHRDPTSGQCVPDADDTVTEQEDQQCGDGEHYDKEQRKCVPNVTEQEEQPPPAPASHKCPTGQHWDDSQSACVADAEVAAPVTTELLKTKLKPFAVKETAPKLKLGEPFGGYTNFEDCVAKNQDKENPEAYCGQIKHQVEEETYLQRKVEEKLNEITDVINELSTVKDDLSWVPRLAAVEKKFSNVGDWATIKLLLAEIDSARKVRAKLTEALQKLPADDVAWRKMLTECNRKVKALETSEVKAATLLSDKVKELHAQNEATATAVNELKETLTGKVTTLEETISAQKKDFETILEQADKNIVETRKTLEERITTLTKEKQDLEKKVTETAASNSKKLEETAELKTRVENLEDKQKPTFKGKPKQVVEKAEVASVNPYAHAG